MLDAVPCRTRPPAPVDFISAAGVVGASSGRLTLRALPAVGSFGAVCGCAAVVGSSGCSRLTLRPFPTEGSSASIVGSFGYICLTSGPLPAEGRSSPRPVLLARVVGSPPRRGESTVCVAKPPLLGTLDVAPRLGSTPLWCR